MHTPVCRDAREFWPESSPTDISVASLPAAGAITNPIRISGCGPWLGFWGPAFAGLRVGYEPTGKSYPVINGLAVPYPIDANEGNGVDLFLSRDPGGVGTVSIARFKTEEAARAWGGTPTPSTGSSSGSSDLPNRSTISIDTVAAGVINKGWGQAGFLYATLHAGPSNAANILINGLFPLAPGSALNGFVSTAAGYAATGTNGDVVNVIEYGRV